MPSQPPADPGPTAAAGDTAPARRRAGLVLRILGLGWAAALVFHAVMRLRGRAFPWNSFLFAPADRFNDLVATLVQGRAPNPYFVDTPAVAAYFPFPYLALRALTGWSVSAVVALYVTTTLAAMLGLWAAWAWSVSRRPARPDAWRMAVLAGLAVTLAGYPLLFALDRGNLDPLITVTMIGAMALLERGHAAGGALVLALSASAKGYSLVALLAWLKRRQLAGAALAVLALAALVIGPAAAFEGGLPRTLEGLGQSLATFRARYVLGGASSHYSADWINGLRLAFEWAGAPRDMRPLVQGYEVAAAVLAGLLGLHALLLAQRPWRELLGLVLLMLFFPNVTNDYKLVLLVPVVLRWLVEPGSAGWRDPLFGACAALLLVPKHYYFLFPGRFASVSCLVSPLLLAGLALALWPTPEEAGRLQAGLAWARRRGSPRTP